MNETTKTDHLFRLENRRRIYEHIRRMPGIHLRQIQRDLGMSMGTLEYHLRRLEKNGLVVTREANRFKSYFAMGELDRRDKDYLYYLRQRMPRRIAAEIAGQNDMPLKELVQRMPIAPSTLSFHLKKLVRSQIVHEYTQGREKFLRLANPVRMQRLLSTYGPLWEAHNRADEENRALTMRDLLVQQGAAEAEASSTVPQLQTP